MRLELEQNDALLVDRCHQEHPSSNKTVAIDLVKQVKDLPAIPQIATKLLQAVQDPECDNYKLFEILRHAAVPN